MGHGYIEKQDLMTINDKINLLKKYYIYDKGYFGIRGKGRNFVRNIECENPIEDSQYFYDLISNGGEEQKMRNNDYGVVCKLPNGIIISYREVSSSDGTPVVEINIRSSREKTELKNQKIHFIKEKKEK